MSPVIGDFIRNLIIIIFLNALLEMMLPQGGFHRYIRLITGLIVILLVVSTIAALIGKASRLEPVTAAVSGAAAGATGAGAGAGAVGAGEAGMGEAGGRQERVGAAYSRQVLQQCRTALEKVLREEVAATGRWQVAGVVLVLEEDDRSSAFGVPLQVDLVVEAAGKGGDAGGGVVAPVHIAPVVVGGQQGAAGVAEGAVGVQAGAAGVAEGAVGIKESAGGGVSGSPRRLPELEQSLARLLELSLAQISVTVLE